MQRKTNLHEQRKACVNYVKLDTERYCGVPLSGTQATKYFERGTGGARLLEKKNE